MASNNTVYVITGANRGIGLGLFQAYLARSLTTVVGVVRSEASAAALEEAATTIKKGAGSRYHVVLLDFTETTSPTIDLEIFQSATESSLDLVDALICSAGHAGAMQPILTTQHSDLRECFEVNTIGPLAAFQMLFPLLEKAKAPKFVVLSSSLGSIGDMEPLPSGGYGPSKAAVNHILKGIHEQLESVISVALHPGFVQTDMGYAAAKQWGFASGPPLCLADSVENVINVIDGATKTTVSGRFVSYDGTAMAW